MHEYYYKKFGSQECLRYNKIMNNYFELKISINPEIEEIVSDIFFSNFDCEGVVLAEEAYKRLRNDFHYTWHT